MTTEAEFLRVLAREEAQRGEDISRDIESALKVQEVWERDIAALENQDKKRLRR